MIKKFAIGLMLLMFVIAVPPASFSAQTVVASKAFERPIIDGSGDDPSWKKAQAVITHDKLSNIDVALKAVYTDNEIFFLVTFPDPNESRIHKAWVWDENQKMYRIGPDREDCFVFKWNMELKPKDLSVYADVPYVADIWFWKACRTDPAGFADDKIQRLSLSKLPRSIRMPDKSGKMLYLQRIGDQGTPAYKNTLYIEYNGDTLPNFKTQNPKGSRADIRAKGSWSNGKWTIEFGRKLNSGHEDDIQFSPGKRYQFGISRNEIGGKKPDPNLAQPLYGAGDVSERLFLSFGQ
jgi:hypothetical protein